MKDQLLAALGAGLGWALLFFPLTWLAMRKQFRLRPLLRHGWQFAAVVAALAIASAVGLLESPATALALPICACAAMLAITKPG